jgi:hypothetical protein
MFFDRSDRILWFICENRPGSIKKHWNIGFLLVFIGFYWFVLDSLDFL